MDTNIANAVGGYFETLYNINVTLIKLCGTDIFDHHDSDEKLVLDIIQDIYRLFPYKYDNEKKVLMLDNTGGLIEFKDAFDFLEKDFSNILKNNYEFLDSIRKIRNKYEHKMHAVKIVGRASGSLMLFDFRFIIGKGNITLYAGNFIRLLTQLNSVYSKIQSDVASFAYKNGESDHLYYMRLSKFEFSDFEKIYKDDNLRLIGKLMHTF